MPPQDPINDQPKFLICHDCYAKQPATEFGLAKYSASGISSICKQCRRQYQKLSRIAKRDPTTVIPELYIRSVYGQNIGIISNGLQHNDFWCVGFVPHTNKRFRIHFGPSRYLIPSMAIFNQDASTYLELAFSGVPAESIKTHIINILKEHKIRLELDDAGIELSNQFIYFY